MSSLSILRNTENLFSVNGITFLSSLENESRPHAWAIASVDDRGNENLEPLCRAGV